MTTRHREPTVLLRDIEASPTLGDRLFANTRPNGYCIEWQGGAEGGYGRMYAGSRNGKPVAMLTHRVAYELLVGEPDPALVLDHLCKNRACVNPVHLDQ